MIFILLLILAFNFFYMMVLIVPSGSSWAFILLFALIYLYYFGSISRKPEYTLYGFLLLFLFFPKSGNNFGIVQVEESARVSLSAIFLSIAAMSICLRVIQADSFETKISRNLKKFCGLVSVIAVLVFFLSAGRQLFGSALGTEVLPEELAWSCPLLYGVAFLYGSVNFIDRMEHIERIFTIVILSGMELALEAVLYLFLKLPLPFAQRVIHESGRFNGFFFADYVTLTVICFSSIGFTLYFIFAKKKPLLSLAIPLFFIPIVNTYQRTPMAAGVLILGSFLLFGGYLRRTVTALTGILFGLIVFSNKFIEICFESLKGLFQGRVRPDYFISYMDSWTARLGAWTRGLDVFIFSFPFGVGPGRIDQYMSTPGIPNYFGIGTEWGETQNFYWQIATGEHVTGPHNLYVSLLGEYGVAGALLIFFLIVQSISNSRSLKCIEVELKECHPDLFFASVAAKSVLLGIAFWSVYYHYIFYWLVFFLFFLSFFPLRSRCDHRPAEAL
ncbi:MAG: O-antigen ligase family protein [Pseudomonadota bacterium]